MDTPWHRNPGTKNRLCLETTNSPDYPDMFLLEDDTNGENYLTREYGDDVLEMLDALTLQDGGSFALEDYGSISFEY
jgi:hypothetical protein